MSDNVIAATAYCDMCGLESLLDDYNKELFVNGIVLCFDGYYGAFHDNIDKTPRANLCHDCTATIWRMIPKFSKFGANLHADLNAAMPKYSASSSCCEFSS
jgi:hypothetical protein